MKIFHFIRLFRNRYRLEGNVLKLQQFQAKWILDRLSLKNMLKEMEILDLACGQGGYAFELAKYAKLVYALDLNILRNLKKSNILPIQADALNIPLQDNSIDFIFCSSLIEHIPDQNRLVSEIRRILKPDGICYLSTIPWYCPLAGHGFKPFHLLGYRLAVKLSKIFYGKNAENSKTSFNDWGLYPITLREIKKLVRRNNLKILGMTSRWIPVNIAKVPYLNEIFAGHVEFILQKISSVIDNESRHKTGPQCLRENHRHTAAHLRSS